MVFRPVFRVLAGGALLVAPLAARAEEPAAEVKVGLGIEKMEVKDAQASFTVDAGTKIYAWTKVTGCAGSSVTVAFLKGDATVFSKELDVPNSPHRTNAFRTFRAGDGGSWTVKVADKDGKELGKATFTVEVK